MAVSKPKLVPRPLGLVNIEAPHNDEPLFIPVTVTGIKASSNDESCSCEEVMILGIIASTKSTMAFKVSQFADSLAKVESVSLLNQAIKKAEAELEEITNHHYLARKRLALQVYVEDQMTKEQAKDFHDNLLEQKKDQRPLTEHELKEHAQIAVCIVNNISPDQRSYNLK